MSIQNKIKLPPLQEKAAKMFSEGFTQSEIGVKLGKNRVTINKWAQNPDFQKKVDFLRTDLLKKVDDILTQGVEEAAEAIIAIAKGEGAPGVVASQLKAALYIVDKIKKEKLPPPKVDKRDLEAQTEAELLEDEEALEYLGR